MLAAGIATVLSPVLPRWLGWVSIVLGVLNLTPLGFIGSLLAVVWVLVVSILLARAPAVAGAAPHRPHSRPVSAHTVDFHLRQIFRKLEFRSRVELTGLVLKRAEAR